MSLKNSGFTRREFLRLSILGSGLMAVPGVQASEHPGLKDMPLTGDYSMPKRTFGNTGEQVSLLGIGAFPFSHDDVSIDQVTETLTRAVELGVNYVDTAPNYGEHNRMTAEEKMGYSLKDLRDQFFLVTKTEQHTYDGTWRLLEQSLKRMKTDHIDLIHLHDFGAEHTWPDLEAVFSKSGAIGALQQAKEQGLVKYIGVSGHLYPSRFHYAIDSGQIDAMMCAVNYINQHTYDFEHKIWYRAGQQGLGLVAMKILGGRPTGGAVKGYRIPNNRYQQTIRYTLSLPYLSTACIGVRSVDELEQAARAVALLPPLSPEEAYALSVEGLNLAQTDKWKEAYGSPLK